MVKHEARRVMRRAMSKAILKPAILFCLVPGTLLLPAVPSVTRAQEPARAEREGALPRDVVHEITALYNAPGTKRARGPFELAPQDTIDGDLAVLDGPATISGVITGQLVVINGDVVLSSTAVVLRNITVVGGTVVPGGSVSGDIRAWSARLRYREVESELIPEADNEMTARWQRWRYTSDDQNTRAEIFLSAAHTYNRVEGLPLYIGPRLRWTLGEARFDFEGYGIVRLGNSFDSHEDLGHRVWLEARPLKESGLAIGGRLFDEVDAVEKWQLSDGEASLAAFLFTRDYRDFWNRHGGSVYARLFQERRFSAALSFGTERWTSRAARDPWTIFNSDIEWRANPLADEGVVRLLTLSADADTRNDVDMPRTGWLAHIEYERGAGDLVHRSPYNTPFYEPVATDEPLPAATHTSWGRIFMDVRRYNRLGPGAQLNLRLVTGGWLHGSPLPQQRRFAVSGVGALPGYDFRRLMTDAYDSGSCVAVQPVEYAAAGRPANCQRMALVQAEFKGDIRIHLFGDRDYGDSRWYTSRFNADGNWVLFANSGRGWSPRIQGSESEFDITSVSPAFSSWRTDVGGGFDFGTLGVYIAKAVTYGGESANVFVRLGRRF